MKYSSMIQHKQERIRINFIAKEDDVVHSNNALMKGLCTRCIKNKTAYYTNAMSMIHIVSTTVGQLTNVLVLWAECELARNCRKDEGNNYAE